MEDLLKQILTARVYDVADRTPLDTAETLSATCNNNVFLKREDLQPVFSFKLRGAFNRISHLTEEERQRGVICASAGNHAQGVALAAKELGIKSTIVMPRTTPNIKVRAVQRLGGDTVLAGDNYTEAFEHCQTLIESTGQVFVHPFNDPLVIAGQGTVGHEILQDCPDADYVFVPIGGGGLISGIAGFLKATNPHIKIIGVEPVDSAAMSRSLEAGHRVVLDEVGIFADGVAVKEVGDLTFSIVSQFVDEVVIVSTDETCSAIKSIYEDTRSIMEPAGALAVAGLKKYVKENNINGKNIVAVNSGANMNFERMQFVAERTLTGERREALFAVTIPEKPGALKFFCENLVGERAITEFNYRLSSREDAHIFVGISISNDQERASFLDLLQKHGYAAEDLTDNDLAKTHVRHMVGGKSAALGREVLYTFEFPERPKALTDFLVAMKSGNENWNISLFHYRNHGGDFGRGLVGFEYPEGDDAQFKQFLENLRYGYHEETDNPAYRLFL